MSRFFTRTMLFLAFLVFLMGTTMWILNGAEVGGLVAVAEEVMKKTWLSLGKVLVNV